MNNENKNEITFFAETTFRNERKKFGIKTDDRRRHMYIIGQTGTGKTTLQMNMMISDILAGRGMGFVDPHGEMAERLLHYIPENRIKDVIYFNPADMEFPIAFNAIETIDAKARHLVASGLMGVFKKIWPDVWSARMEYILNNTILALLEVPGSTLLGVNRMFSDKAFRKNIVNQISDPVIKAFWTQEYAAYQQKYEQEATAAIQNKIGQFSSATIIRNIIGQPTSSFNFRQAMDEGKIVIMNLSKGRLGEDNTKLLGGMLITKIQLAAMSRVDILEEDRKDFYLYVDEFQTFVTDSFADILSEARKFRLDLTIANQYIGQLVHDQNVKVKDAIFGNVGTFIAFRAGGEDVEFLEEKQFSPNITAQDLLNLPNYNIYLRLLIDGVPSRPFSAITLPPYSKPEISYADEIIEYSRITYGTPKAEVESTISIATGVLQAEAQSSSQRDAYDLPSYNTSSRGPSSGERGAFDDKKNMFSAVCANCGKNTTVPFKPDPTRPVYCKDCFSKTSARQRPEPQAMAGRRPPVKPVHLSQLRPRTQESPAPKAMQGRQRKTVDTEGLKKILEETIGK
ncbi:MAG: type IV secretion system DNA-binding domain-containing protein [Parcubacteria group bacterium]|nr:type IV secretion system DNA-binding domain-containing protein [Parcubacteria group bacterium]